MQIIVDTREQSPYSFATITPPPETIRATLKTGDYSLAGYENKITIERKSLIDAFGTFGEGCMGRDFFLRRRLAIQKSLKKSYPGFGLWYF